MGARDYAELCRPVLEDMAQEAGRTVVLLGHSFGGRVALCLADLAPDRVLGLVLTGTPFGLNRSDGKVGSPFGYRMIRAARKWHLVSEAVLESARTRYGSTDYRNAQGVMREVLVRTVGESYGDELARLSLPLHLVWARDDTEARLDQAEAAAGIARKAQLRVLDGESHMLVLTPAGQSALSAEIGALLEADSCGSPSVDLATEKR
jgi:pimeloyl-ACP methyl ester carboxylesterase